MQKIINYLLLQCIICLPLCGFSQKATLEFLSGDIKDGDSLNLYIFPINDYLNKPEIDKRNIFEKADVGKLRWEINIDEPLYISFRPRGEKIVTGIIEPGDNIVIRSEKGKRIFSGKGAMKLKIKDDTDSAISLIPQPANKCDYITNSIEDYLEWNRYLDKQLKTGITIFDNYKSKVSASSLKFLKASFVDQNIDDRSDKFNGLRVYIKNNSLDPKIICDIYDTAYLPSVKDPFNFTSSYMYGNLKPIMFESYRKQSFKVNKETKEDEIKWVINWYTNGINTYKGIQRQQFILEVLYKYLAKEYGFTSEIEKLYKEYYASNPPEEFRKAAREKELELRERINAKKAVDFNLIDRNGKEFYSQRLKGKVAVLDFWFTGCAGCVPMAQVLKKVEQNFVNDTNIVFVKISIDQNKEKWIKSISQGKYTSQGGIHLYTGGSADNHEIIARLGINGYPELVILDAQCRTVPSFKYIDPRKDNGKDLSALLQKQLSVLRDGPYLFYEKDSITAYSISGNNIISSKYSQNSIAPLYVQSDQLKPFNVSLKKSLHPGRSVFERPGKLIALSDIEGNFDAFRKLLQANQVIDDNYNWTFGNGHLVFDGDMFDRGEQVTECLWLIYSLEEKAKAAGGYVHFVLGNHEVMNMQGNHKYVQEKYKQNAQLLGKSLTDLYGGNTELGRWLRTKNIMEIIGDLLFVHGGIGVEFTDAVSLSIEEINKAFRDNMMKKIKYNDPDKNLSMIFSEDIYSPYWYRLYYRDEDKQLELVSDTSVKFTIIHPSMQQMNRVLDKWKVKRIITGHTIVADTISTWYNNKVINIDTKHAEGKSGALLIEGKTFYRLNSKGKRILLFKDR